MNLKVHIHKIKCVNDLDLELPLEHGLYAITGMNGSGKSTIAACTSSVFFNMRMNEYFGTTAPDSSISFELNGAKKKWLKVDGERGKIWKVFSEGHVAIKGFFEGSLIFGNRFKDNSFEKVLRLERVKNSQLIEADDFIRKNLGKILNGDENYYEKLFYLKDQKEFKGKIFFYEKDGHRVSQFHMSTGENLLISILNSLLMRINNRNELDVPCLVFLDEIELALHPSSLKRLVQFLEDMSSQYNYAIYFSTHSLELIGGIPPTNIIYINRHADNTIEIVNPCYPAYATRMLYDHTGYDNVIMVEDDLAKAIVDQILKREKLLNGKLVHVLPCGGWSNVVDLAQDTIRFNLMGKITSICAILDGDVKSQLEGYKKNKGITNNIRIGFLPIESLEKYLKRVLFVHVDQKFFRQLNDYLFQQKSLSEIIEEYRVSIQGKTDNDGKKLFALISEELKERRISRDQLVNMTVEHIVENQQEDVNKIIAFLKDVLSV
ncbi:MAG: AAA family ATPase [Bacteroidaceae bacterium]|nr:AAA family ATPase [Bacteroidaceae bacterium]